MEILSELGLGSHAAILLLLGLVVAVAGILVFLFSSASKWPGFAVIVFGGVLVALPVLQKATLTHKGFELVTIAGYTDNLAEAVEANAMAIEDIRVGINTFRGVASQTAARSAQSTNSSSAANSTRRAMQEVNKSLSRASTSINKSAELSRRVREGLKTKN